MSNAKNNNRASPVWNNIRRGKQGRRAWLGFVGIVGNKAEAGEQKLLELLAKVGFLDSRIRGKFG